MWGTGLGFLRLEEFGGGHFLSHRGSFAVWDKGLELWELVSCGRDLHESI